jgi:hypothetical protein
LLHALATIMVCGCGEEGRSTGPHVHNFGLKNEVWECPDFFFLDGKPVFLVARAVTAI